MLQRSRKNVAISSLVQGQITSPKSDFLGVNKKRVLIVGVDSWAPSRAKLMCMTLLCFINQVEHLINAGIPDCLWNWEGEENIQGMSSLACNALA